MWTDASKSSNLTGAGVEKKKPETIPQHSIANRPQL
jgi:hypothetical protein